MNRAGLLLTPSQGYLRHVEGSTLNTFAKGPDGKARVTLRMWERAR